MAKVAINGFGRIGRAFFRMAHTHPDIEIVAINDLGQLENLAYLLEYDTVYGRGQFSIDVTGGKLVVDGKEVAFVSERDPKALPWKDMGIDVGNNRFITLYLTNSGGGGTVSPEASPGFEGKAISPYAPLANTTEAAGMVSVNDLEYSYTGDIVITVPVDGVKFVRFVLTGGPVDIRYLLHS